MTIGSSMINEVAAGVAVIPEQLKHVRVYELDADDFAVVEGLIKPRDCYLNSVKASVELGACAIVFGAAYFDGGMVVEHCWLRVDGTHYDPTYQALGCVSDAEYFALVDVCITDYLDVAKRIGRADRVINMHDLRMSPHYREYFAKNSRNLQEAR